jgi:hypothetical protein
MVRVPAPAVMEGHLGLVRTELTVEIQLLEWTLPRSGSAPQLQGYGQRRRD